MPRPTLAQKRDFVAKAFCPRALVLSTPAIADACAVNNCSTFADLLAPFGQDVSTQITIQDGQGAPYFLDKLNIKFTTDFKIKKRSPHSRTEIDDLVHTSVADDSGQANVPFLTEHGVDPRELSSDISMWAPWYTLFRQQWISTMQASEHESFMHPVACVLVASGSEEDPVGALRTLQSHPAVNRVQTQGFSGANVLFYYVLVHDGRDSGVLQTIDHKFDQVRRAFGQNSSLLKINSNTDLIEADTSEQSKISSIWANSLSTTEPLTPHPDSVFGSMLNMRDVTALRDAVKQMMVRGIVPHMQYMIRVLSDQTANQRRGITGRLFSAGRRYFGTAAKASSTQTGVDGDVYFCYDSAEAQMRKLADYSFMLKDFRFAQSVYQVARRDFQSEKAWKCYAGAQEMVGVCKLMLEVHATRAEFDSNFEDAVTMYLHKTHAPCQHLAIRCIVIYYELLKHHKLYSFAPSTLLRVPSTSGALRAMASEQAAYSFLKFPNRPELRKFSFYAMLAAQEYQKAGIASLAHRCLRMVRLSLGATLVTVESESPEKPVDDVSTLESGASRALASSNWSSIDSYINHELGTQCMAAQDYDHALQYFMALMGSDQIPPKLQSKYLQELLQLYLESSDKLYLESEKALTTDLDGSQNKRVELSVPTIDARMIRVIMSPDLEGEDGVLEWRYGGAAPTAHVNGSADLRCSVGESVAVLLVVKNPLTIGITLNGFTLDCHFDADAAHDAEATNGNESESPAFAITTVDTVVLEGGQTSMVTVTITTHRAGRLTIRGATYLLCDILPTYKTLKMPGKRLNDTMEQRVTPTYSADTQLGFQIDASFPRLEAVLEDFPDTLMSGSMQRALIRLTNCAQQPCQSIMLWLSHPSFFDVASPLPIGADEASAELAESQSMYVYSDSVETTAEVLAANVLRDCSMFVIAGPAIVSDGSAAAGTECEIKSHALVPVETLGPGESLLVPVWIRGDRVGAHTLSMAIGASTTRAVTTTGCKMRTRKFEIDLVVTPSLRVNAFVRPSVQNPHERILGIEVENVQSGLDIQLVQSTFTSGHYELSPLRTGNMPRVVRVGSKQTVNLMYKAMPRAGDVQTQPEQFTIAALQQYIFAKDKPTAVPAPVQLVYSNAVLGHQGIDSTHSSLQGYIARSQAHRRRTMLRNAYPLIPDKFHSALFPLYETFGIDFVLFWSEIGGKGRTGHHSITGIDLGVPHDYINEALTPPASGAARMWLKDTEHDRQDLIQSIANRSAASAHRTERTLDVALRLTGVRRVSETDTLCVADIEVSVYNHSWQHAYDATLRLVSPSESDQAPETKPECSGPRAAWTWCGVTTHTLSVKALGSVCVQAQVACSALGVIDVGKWELSATAVNASATISPYAKSLECRLHPLHPSFINVTI
ncbi:hypothetical protein IW147_004705 [Coemansia sp. RSA 720]|nr:hypothetical protein IW147_004705 [Coemansia sp. RSA 720]